MAVSPGTRRQTVIVRLQKREHPLIVRLREITHKLQSITETDKSMRSASAKGETYIRGFYAGAIQNGTLAAKLIEQAIKNYPLDGTGQAGVARSHSPSRKGGAR